MVNKVLLMRNTGEIIQKFKIIPSQKKSHKIKVFVTIYLSTLPTSSRFLLLICSLSRQLSIIFVFYIVVIIVVYLLIGCNIYLVFSWLLIK